jgi:hypothetical protein
VIAILPPALHKRRKEGDEGRHSGSGTKVILKRACCGWSRTARRKCIAIPTNQSAEVGGVPDVIVQRVVPEYDITEFSTFVGDRQGNDNSTIVGDVGFKSVCVLQRVKINLRTVYG